ncbi:hypothetical protein SSCG_05226 [Streptomyces clavuligerus]|nr:hypothetical protein SSCG_05226 [Streptomyces clavuligerus]
MNTVLADFFAGVGRRQHPWPAGRADLHWHLLAGARLRPYRPRPIRPSPTGPVSLHSAPWRAGHRLCRW